MWCWGWRKQLYWVLSILLTFWSNKGTNFLVKKWYNHCDAKCRYSTSTSHTWNLSNNLLEISVFIHILCSSTKIKGMCVQFVYSLTADVPTSMNTWNTGMWFTCDTRVLVFLKLMLQWYLSDRCIVSMNILEIILVTFFLYILPFVITF